MSPVIRRVGGLEDRQALHRTDRHVIRRVGGLEAVQERRYAVPEVIRRVGGLEGPYPPRRR